MAEDSEKKVILTSLKYVGSTENNTISIRKFSLESIKNCIKTVKIVFVSILILN